MVERESDEMEIGVCAPLCVCVRVAVGALSQTSDCEVPPDWVKFRVNK